MKKKNLSKLLALALVGGAMSFAVACNPPAPTYYNVTINGTVESVEKNELLTEPMPLEDYESNGYLYVFEGWQYTDGEGNTKLWNFETDKVTGNVVLTPKYTQTEIQLGVTFKNGDTTISSTVVNKSNGKVTAPTVEQTYDDVDANKRYTFKYWYVLDNGVERKWNFAVDKVTTDGTVIYAKYSSVPLTVAVTINGTVVNVPYGGTVSRPEVNPTKEPDLGYTYEFKFWMCNGNLYDFATVITEPIEIVPYFKKTERLYNIAIDLDNGTVINRENVAFGTTLSDFTPTTITKASTIDTVYTFSHFEDVNGEEVTEVNGSATYKAIYTTSVRKYDVTISVDGKTSVENVEYGSNLLTLLGAPTKAEDDDAIYTFSHWVDDENNVIGDTDTVKGEMTYTAVYDVEYKRYTITFDVNGNITTKKINVGEELADYLPTDTDKPTDTVLGKIYTFSHWVDSKGNTVTGDTKVTDFETYTAVYDEKDYNGTMSISDVVIATKDSGRYVPVIFSKKGFSAPLTYTFEGNDISISDKGFITVNNVGKTVVVTAKNEENQMEDTFTVKTYDKVYDYVSTSFSTSFAVNNNFGSRYTTHKADIEAKLVKDTDSIVFMGDSFFDAGRYNAPGSFWSDFYTKYFPGKNAYSFGVGGTRTDEVTDWVSAVVPYAPKTLVVHVGTNDIYDLNKSGEQTGRDVVDMLATLHNALPNTQIYYFSVEYRTYKRGIDASLDVSNQQADISNAMAKEYCDNTDKVTFLDSLKYFTTTGVSKGGYIDANKLRDTVHIKLENYYVYTDLLKEAGVNFDDYVIKVQNPIQQTCGDGEVTLSGDTLTINNAGKGSRTRAYLYDTKNQKYIQGNVAVWGTMNMKDIVVANNQFAEILLMEKPDNSWATANNYNIIDAVIRKHGGQNVVKPVIWGFGVGGENSAYVWKENDYSIDFSLIVKGTKAYLTLDGETKILELKSDKLYVGFGSENLNYTITGFTMSTDSSVIDSKIPANVVVNDVDEFTTDVTKGVRDNQKIITVNNNPLATAFVISGKLDLLEAPAGANAHIEFKFNGNDNYRYLLWDNNDSVNYNYKVAFNMGSGYNTSAPDKDIFMFENKTLTLTWKVVLADGYSLFYVNDQLRVVNKGGADVTAFNLSAEKAKVRFYDIKAYLKSNDPDGFATQKSAVQADINKYASSANGTYRA